MTFACIPSVRPKQMLACIGGILERNAEENALNGIIVVDDSKEKEDNEAKLKELSEEHGMTIKQSSSDSGYRYGSPRNVGLGEAAESGEDVVFFDDDVVVQKDCLTRFGKLFAEGKKIIHGTVNGRQAGLKFILASMQSSLLAYGNGGLTREETAGRFRTYFGGLSDEAVCNGFTGACMGVSGEAAKSYCFFPTDYRVEDGLYFTLSKYFVEGGAFLPDEASAPRVRHEPAPREIGAFNAYWRETVKGVSIALSIEYLLKNRLEASDENAALACREAPEQLLENFGEEKTMERREVQKEFDGLIAVLGDEEISREYGKYAGTKLGEVSLPLEEMEKEVKRFFRVQAEWKKRFTS